MPRGAQKKENKLNRFEKFRADSSFLRHYLWKYRKYVGLGLLTLVVVDCLEVVPPFFLKRAVDVSLGGGERDAAFNQLLWIALSYLGVSLIQGVCRYGWRMYLIRSSMYAGRDLRSKFAHHVFHLSSSFFDRRPIGELMSLATNDVEAVRVALGAGLLVFADAMIYFIAVPIAMWMLSPQLMVLAFVPLPIIPWLVLRNEREIHTRFEKVQESFAGLSAMAQESLAGVRVLKAFAREDAQIERFRLKGENYLRLHMELARVQTAFGPTLDFTMSLGLVLLLFAGGKMMIGPQAVITLGTFVAFQRYIQKMVWPMAALGMSISYYQRSISSSNRIKEILEISSDVPEVSHPQLPVFTEGKTRGAVEFRNLNFRFPGDPEGQYVLKEISLKIEPGERIAFLGTVGAGKSALLALLPRIYPVGRGMLFIDEIDINDWPLEELRKQVGFVSQDVFLFSETVTENVAFGLLDAKLSIEEATRLAAVHEEVLGLSSAYRTRLGERGVNLSGGQKQRLTIARAIAKQPAVLVLDDALSSVDVQTEERILGGLRARPQRNTEIIAAHRISTIQDADRIVVLEHGSIRQLGTHQELLLDRRGMYRQVYEQQRLKEDLEGYVESLEGAHELRP